MDRLSPLEVATFDSHAERHGERYLPGTRVDLLREVDEWAEDPGREHIYWLRGMAGTGKSTISRTVAHKLDQELPGRSSRLGASFFFKRGEGDMNDWQSHLVVWWLRCKRLGDGRLPCSVFLSIFW